MMNTGSNEGMRLARTQPPDPGFSVRHQAADPKIHRLGLLKMKIGSSHALRDPKTGARRNLTVRDRSRFAKVPVVLVCLHPMCAGKSWKTEEDMITDHPTLEAMVDGSERHVVGLFSNASVEAKDEGSIDLKKLIDRAKASIGTAEKALYEAKDEKGMAEALERHTLAEKNHRALQAMSVEKANEIVGFLSDER